jgi:hypothetical protein
VKSVSAPVSRASQSGSVTRAPVACSIMLGVRWRHCRSCSARSASHLSPTPFGVGLEMSAQQRPVRGLPDDGTGRRPAAGRDGLQATLVNAVGQVAEAGLFIVA